MGVYVYCIVPADFPLPHNLRGLAGAEVCRSSVSDLAIWWSAGPRPDPSVETVQTHNRVVEAAVTEAVTPVPMRFGQWAPEAATIETAIAEKADWYHDRLRAFAGAMEFGLRLGRAGAQASARVLRQQDAITGLEYMKALRERTAAAQAAREDVDTVSALVTEVVAAHVRETRLEPPASHGMISIMHLVPRSEFAAYRAAAEAIKVRLPERRLLVSGPWVPYSFAV